ncbi:MAG: alpha-galactosidase [Chloroflexi bacterium]|nr:alpha-galactosidase [Chloroflexota bacterium]
MIIASAAVRRAAMTADSLTPHMPVHRSEFEGRPAWVLATNSMSMVLCLGADNTLYLPHWGSQGGASPRRGSWGAPGGSTRVEHYLPSVPRNRPSEATFLDGQPLAYPAFGMPTFKEACLVIATDDGARGSRFSYVEDSPRDDSLDLTFEDDLTGARLTLTFAVYADLIARSARISNVGDRELRIERALSAALPLPPDEYDLLTLTGQWGREFELTQRPLLPGRTTLGSTRGLSSHEAHPWFAIRPRGEQQEHAGRVWVGSLAWSGNWQLVVDVERNDALNICMGIQPFDFSWCLQPGESFATPLLVCGYSEHGLGGASHLLHTFEESTWLPENHRDEQRPVLYNSWEATHFNVTAGSQIELARNAADLGVELFVVDDGWFGQRAHDRAGLGDWVVNAEKFPKGLSELIDEVHRLGMGFGIWVEPEMVNPDSDLYRAHPDWAYHAEGRTATLGRNQMVLNFARQDVQEHIFEQLRRLLSDHGQIRFIKWDHNRAWTEVGWPEQPRQQREVWVRHVLGLYDVWARLRAAFPDLSIESCASGGGRADLGALRYTDQVWTSDNTDAADRLTMQYGYSRAHSPRVMVNWVTDVPNERTGRDAPLQFRFLVAMQGVLGIGGNISQWSDHDRAVARHLIAQYKTIRPLVQHGRQHWLRRPAAIGACAVQYVSESADATAVLLYQVRGLRGQGPRRMRLHGLRPDATYRREGDGRESTGAALMAAGLPATLVNSGARHPSLDFQTELQIWRAD